jgi:hypothetical protein
MRSCVLLVLFTTTIVACSTTPSGEETTPSDLTGQPPPGSSSSSSSGNTADPNPKETQSAKQRCSPSTAFDAPTPVGGLEAIDGTARFTPDQLGVVFSNRMPTGSVDLFQATRASISDPFGAPSRLTGINAEGPKLFPALAKDQKTLWFASMHETEPGNPRVDIFVATRSSETSSTFQGTKEAIGLNVFRENTTPFATKHAAEIWYAAGPDADQYEIFHSKIGSNGTASDPLQVTELNTPYAEAAPVLSDDGLVIYWSSTRPDGGAEGDHDVWVAVRPDASARFGQPKNVKELNTYSLEYPAWLSPDLCQLYIARGGALLMASRQPQ